MQKINSLAELKELAAYSEKHGMLACFILLSYGARSSKGITYYPDTETYDVHNEIDDSYQEDITEEQLRTETFIVEAIEKGAFYKYDF